MPQSARSAARQSAYDAIVIGGSSGSIEALMALLSALPARLGAAVLVVLHLPSGRRSLLADIFKDRCALRVCEAQDKDIIQPGAVYFAPPDYHLLVERGPRVALSVDPPLHFSRPSIDVLFESAADQYGAGLIGVLLSGANDDGVQGLAAICSGGGLAVVQDPASAAMPVMPAAALDRVPVRHVLDPQGIAKLLARLAAHPRDNPRT
ncbi:chemotaxis protein CheB [Bordetella petrii]|uniref:chemotaxis protein CheB n=1 Tax=Bordetella petrii TaxID=94624 RepID=UPI001E58947D|nr:chemotaxis protein CheB [Bordetella petrii]MCD0501752.1 chemotaxis protein CheB [Bordetella petrii]